MCVWSRRTKGVVRDEAMNERRVEERSREEVWGGMCWWNDEKEGEREREREKEAQTEFFQAHTHTHMHQHAEVHRTAISKWNSNSAHLQKLQDNNH